MAPFNTHFLVAEKIWPELQNGPWQTHFGQFCFGCVAPDVDKASATLNQKDTHFFDRTGDYEAMASRRTAAFIEQQATFLHRPFAELSADAQAFALGYLCHLCLDEVSKHLWRRETWMKFHHVKPTSAFAALDEIAWQHTHNYAAIKQAVCAVDVLDIIPRIPLVDLKRMHQGVCNFVQAKNAEEEYLALIDLFDNPAPQRRQEYRQRFRREIDLAREQVHFFRLEALVQASLAHSRQRLTDLIEGRAPAPGYPKLEK